MFSYFANSTIIGFLFGLGAAVCSTLLVSLLPGPNPYLEFIVDILAGLPVVLVRRIGAPAPFYYLVLFVYSGLNGATVARLLGRWRVAGK